MALTYETLKPWLDETAEKVIDALRERTDAFLKNPATGDDPDWHMRSGRYTKLQRLLDKAATPAHLSASGRSDLHRIIRGYLVEFVRQSEEGVPPCNIQNGRNEAAKAYWEQRPESEFAEAKFRGLVHSASSYRRVLGHDTSGRKAAMAATGDIIRTTIDVFRQEFPKLCPDLEPRASIGNDPVEVAATGNLMDLFMRKVLSKGRTR
jgi:hypothetical protein